MPSLRPLPIDSVLPELIAAYGRHRRVVLQAPPGAGKTTRVPAALLDAGKVKDSASIVVLEPRRLATRLAARRVAEERGEALGLTVGYEVRFERVAGASTRLLYVTEGILTQRILRDPNLEGTQIIVLDEFHERHLHGDFALAWVKRLIKTTRPDLGVVVMSATLDTARVAAFLDAPTVTSEGKSYPVAIEFASAPDDRPLESRIASALHDVLVGGGGAGAIGRAATPWRAAGGGGESARDSVRDSGAESARDSVREERVRDRHADEGQGSVGERGRKPIDETGPGSVLVFLPGAAEIRRAMERCRPLAEKHGLRLVPLHGDLSAAAQDEAVRPDGGPKVILATNVAETSVTIPGVVAVIDSGLARVATHDPWSGRVRLEVAKVSRASAVQRAGRAGRTGPGRALRLYTKGDFETRPEHDTPELLRADLAELVLWLRSMGVGEDQPLEWLDPPPASALDGAEYLLWRLGAIEGAEPGGQESLIASHERTAAGVSSGRLTAVGKRMLAFSLPPRLGRLLVEAERLDVADDGCAAAALLSEGRDLYLREDFASGVAGRQQDDASDLAARVRDFHRARGAPEREVRDLGVDPWVVRMVERTYRQLARRVHARALSLPPDQADERLRRAVLAAYPDRVARRKPLAGDANSRLQTGREVVLSNGGTAWLSDASMVRTAPWLVAIEASDRLADMASGAAGRGGGVGGRAGGGAAGGTPGRAAATSRRTYVWLASAIEPEWLIDVTPTAISETVLVDWDAAGERVVAAERMMYDRLVLDERPAAGRQAEERAAMLLAERAMAAGIATFAGGEAFDRLVARLQFVCDSAPDLAANSQMAPLDDGRARELLATIIVGKRSFAELRNASLLDHVRQGIGHVVLARLDALAPEYVALASGRRAKVQYEAGKPPWIESRLQDFFGTRQGPRVLSGRLALVLHLLAPNGRAVQVTTDLEGFWARTYPGVRSELMRRYPRHAWPADPLTAAPPPMRPRRTDGRST